MPDDDKKDPPASKFKPPKPGSKVDERRTLKHAEGGKFRIRRTGKFGGSVRTVVERVD